MAAPKPPAKPPAKALAKGAKGPRLNFKLELNCACRPPICEHAGPGIAKLLEAAYAKGRADGAKASGTPGTKPKSPVGVRQKGSRRTQ